MKNKSLIFSVALAALAFASSCKKGLDIEPAQSISSDIALTTKEGINANLASIYARMKSPRFYGRDLIAIPEVLADNGYVNNRSGRLLAESNNQNRAHFLLDTWQIGYKIINEAS